VFGKATLKLDMQNHRWGNGFRPSDIANSKSKAPCQGLPELCTDKPPLPKISLPLFGGSVVIKPDNSEISVDYLSTELLVISYDT
jgi:hypothetical protein